MLQRYEDYKESGVDWLGEIPVGWGVRRNKYIFDEKTESVGQRANKFKLLSLTLGGVIPRDMKNPKGKFPAEFNTYKKVNKNDLVFCLFDVEETPRAVGIAGEAGMITGAYTVLESNLDANSSFINYYYLSLDNGKQLKTLYTGLRNVIKIDTFMSIKTPLPDIGIQTAIANFLDDKTAKIDELLEIKRRQIALLRERKQILIQNAVTKGLNPDAPMKESGVDWIGEIPAHWEVKRLKNIASITPGFAFKSSEFIVETNPKFRNIYKLLRGINVNPGKISWRDTVYWNSDQSKLIDNYKLAYGDIVIGMDRPWVSGGIRVAEITATDLPSLLLQRVARIRSNPKVHNYFIRMLITSRQFLVYFEPILTGISVPHISDSQIGNFFCAIPPLKEQEYIFKFQIKIERKINTAIKIKQSQIEKLNEYKTTLINAAVTGKIKVV